MLNLCPLLKFARKECVSNVSEEYARRNPTGRVCHDPVYVQLYSTYLNELNLAHRPPNKNKCVHYRLRLAIYVVLPFVTLVVVLIRSKQELTFQ